MSWLFWGSVVMFPRFYWFLCTKTLQTMYVVGKLTPELIKKIIQDKNKQVNALDSPKGQDDPQAESSLQAS
jgi:hypothetical protein